ncbi:LysR family transcriptional regulator [Stutzerimonas nitrititolerans]|uniref:LysR family transcriptional regulator n=1 Tax=Stutzerimonas nitrititolerans TaxID=2482751 RepID=UPI0007184BDC|nr:LysR family transcriptional regulator [Stutzerimonas nitrititolerans]KRW63501.1 LysR family transcriptional regulator [Pseudomonas sp. TTU2014-096BSC]
MQAAVSFRQLQVFVAVARGGTLARAAEQLSLSQSASSGSLAELERRLEVPLFERVGKRLQLSEAGRRLLPRAERLLDELDTFVEAAREPEGVLRGELMLAASATIGTHLVPSLVGRFTESNPGVEIQTRLRNSDEVIADLLHLEADLGLIEGPCNDSRLSAEVWREDHMCVVCAPGHPLAVTGRLSDEDLRREAWILRESGSGSRAIFEAAARMRTPRLHVRMALNQHEAIKQAVRAGLGLGCLSQLCVAEEVARGELVALENDLPLTRYFSLVWHPQRYRSPLWQAFKVFLREA